jgi:protein O-mannosyl-transferase
VEFISRLNCLYGIYEMRVMGHSWAAPTIILFAIALLYGAFLSNPVLFDDANFFFLGGSEKFLASIGLQTRHFALATLALSAKWLGNGLVSFRVASLLLHAGVAISLYYFLRQLQQILAQGRSKELEYGILLPLVASLAFALNPVAVYGAAYLIQRTIVMGTLFALLCWLCWLRGLQTQRRWWLWASVGAYMLAVLSKEHTVMIPAVSAALALWWWRTQASKERGFLFVRRLTPMLAAYFIVAVLVVLQMRGFLGAVYELDAPEMLRVISVEYAWPLSIITQGFLFFKYLFLWLLPNPLLMSVDMREPFAQSFTAWPQMFGFIAFMLWPLLATYLLWKGGRRGLLGFAMLAPWLLFATELATVRIQESFVLYRSYLWLAPAFSGVLLLAPWLRLRGLLALAVVVPLFLFPLSWNRLTTFSHPLLLWDDAERLVDGRQGLTGLERIYINRGKQLHDVRKYDMAIEDYSKAIAMNANFIYAYNNRGASFLELKRYQEAINDFDISLRLKSDNPRSHFGRGTALAALGRTEEAKQSFRAACALGWQSACAKANQ